MRWFVENLIPAQRATNPAAPAMALLNAKSVEKRIAPNASIAKTRLYEAANRGAVENRYNTN